MTLKIVRRATLSAITTESQACQFNE